MNTNESTELKNKVVHTDLLEVVYLMKELRNKVNVLSQEEEFKGLVDAGKLDDLSEYLCDTALVFCGVIGSVLFSRIENEIDESKKLNS
jgi:hypothetical protein